MAVFEIPASSLYGRCETEANEHCGSSEGSHRQRRMMLPCTSLTARQSGRITR